MRKQPRKTKRTMPKVLVCCPTSDKKEYCDEEYFEQLQSLTYPNYQVFISDNSKNNQYIKKIRKYKDIILNMNRRIETIKIRPITYTTPPIIKFTTILISKLAIFIFSPYF